MHSKHSPIIHPHLLLLTGVPGIGKTTVIRTVAEMLSENRIAGFITAEIREGHQRVGFRLRDFSGHELIMAHVDFPMVYRVGKYGVDVAALDRVAADLLRPDSSVHCYLIDEIGKMECLSSNFVTAMERLMERDIPIIATVARKGEGLIEAVKHRTGATLWEITHHNRNDMPERVIEWLEQRLGQSEKRKDTR